MANIQFLSAAWWPSLAPGMAPRSQWRRSSPPCSPPADRWVLAHTRAVRDAPTHEAGEAQIASLLENVGSVYPAAVKSFAEDLEASVAHLKLPVRHRINVRTTNLLERSFVEERRRTKVIPRLMDEKSAMKLMFATLMRVSERWSRVSISELERKRLGLLREELGIDPPPDEQRRRPPRREGKEVVA